MMAKEQVIGVKNSSMPVMDINSGNYVLVKIILFSMGQMNNL
ncbi:hypothetical protein [Pediococcus acidilactici]